MQEKEDREGIRYIIHHCCFCFWHSNDLFFLLYHVNMSLEIKHMHLFYHLQVSEFKIFKQYIDFAIPKFKLILNVFPDIVCVCVLLFYI